MATELQRLQFSNPAALHGRRLFFDNSTLGTWQMSAPWDKDDQSLTLTRILAGYSAYFTSSSYGQDGSDWYFDLEFLEVSGNVGPTSLAYPLDPDTGVGGKMIATQIVAGVNPDEYGAGGAKEKWSFNFEYFPISGTYQIDSVNHNDHTGPIPISATDLDSYVNPIGIDYLSGDGYPSTPFLLERFTAGIVTQPGMSYTNIDTIVSTFTLTTLRDGGASGALFTAAAT